MSLLPGVIHLAQVECSDHTHSPWIEPWPPVACWGQLECEVLASSNRARHPSMDNWLLPHTAEVPAATVHPTPWHTAMHKLSTHSGIQHKKLHVWVCHLLYTPSGWDRVSPGCSQEYRTEICILACLAELGSATWRSSGRSNQTTHYKPYK